jgi:calcium-binding protein KIC and related proteins
VDTAEAPTSRLHAGTREEPVFEELLSVMRKQLGAAGLLAELRMGFRQLADPVWGPITSDSLRR